MLSPMACYSEIPTEIESPLKTEVILGYELNHFSPTNDLRIKEDSIISNNIKEDEMNVGKIIGVSFLQAIAFYVVIGGVIFASLTILGCILLIVAKIIQIHRKKS